jgi:hypothetical protein
MAVEQVRVYLTDHQCQYLASHGRDQVITMTDDDGWIFVEDAANVGEEGSGVWVDARGQEQHGPVGLSMNRRDDG